jgi:RNA polymerase sigma factor (TIGR02999 family)
MAQRQMQGERPGHTLSATALVHEAYLRMEGSDLLQSGGPAAFYNAAALAMRRILANHARDRGRQKRGGNRAEVDLERVRDAALEEDVDRLDWMALDEALEKLAQLSPRQAQVVNLRYFAGLKDGEIADLLKISEPTVRRDWATARPWLYRYMRGAPQQ